MRHCLFSLPQEVRQEVKELYATSWRKQLAGLKGGELGYVLVMAAKPMEEGGSYM